MNACKQASKCPKRFQAGVWHAATMELTMAIAALIPPRKVACDELGDVLPWALMHSVKPMP